MDQLNAVLTSHKTLATVLSDQYKVLQFDVGMVSSGVNTVLVLGAW